MERQGEPYKVELISDLPADAVISFYRQGDFTDLCAGPHVPDTGKVKAFKILSCTGAYWRGDSSRKMLQRIYGTVFPKKSDLEEYLVRLEEAKRRDHRKLGRELDLFALYDEGPGFPFFFKKGMVLRNQLESFWREEHKKAGYEEIRTPLILNRGAVARSGTGITIRKTCLFTKIDGKIRRQTDELSRRHARVSPASGVLPGAAFGLAKWGLSPHELSGALNGLFRVRCFTQDDAHLYMTPEQVPAEILGVINLIDHIYKVFGFSYKVELSTRPRLYGHRGSSGTWQGASASALETRGLPFVINEGDGAFYGRRSTSTGGLIGRTWQCGTLQLDFQMPERFELEYTGPDGEKHRPVMIHRTVFGSLERFIGILIEHYAGAFPAWLARCRPLSCPLRPGAGICRPGERTAGSSRIRVETDFRTKKSGTRSGKRRCRKFPYSCRGDKERSREPSGPLPDRGDLARRGAGFYPTLCTEIAEKNNRAGLPESFLGSPFLSESNNLHNDAVEWL